MAYRSIEEMKKETGIEEFDAVIWVTTRVTLTLHDEEYRLREGSIWAGPEPLLVEVLEPGLYGACGWKDPAEDTVIYGTSAVFDREDLEALIEMGCASYFRGPD